MDPLQRVNNLATIASALGSLITSFAMVWILILTYKQTARSKRSDLLVEFNRRFENLSAIREIEGPSDPSRPKDTPAKQGSGSEPHAGERSDGNGPHHASSHYWDRFWSLQFDQYTSWLDGHVSESVFAYWMQSRHLDWAENLVINGRSYQDAWNRQRSKFRAHDRFAKFMDKVHGNTIAEAYAMVGKKYPNQHI